MKKSPEECLHCGKCLSECPSYRYFLKEAFSPRGRNLLLAKGYQSESFDYCLLCERCKGECPQGLSFPEFYLEKQFSKKNLKISVPRDSLTLLSFFPSGKNLYRSFKEDWIKDYREGDFYLFLSCGLKHLYPQALFHFLKKVECLSLRAMIPRDQDCCGIPYLSLKKTEIIKDFGLRKLQLFESKKPVVTFCATCFWVFKKIYPLLFAGTSVEGDFVELSQRTYFVFEFIEKFFSQSIIIENNPEVLFHLPCHLKKPLTSVENSLKNKISLNNFCCGSANLSLWLKDFQPNYSKFWRRYLLGKKIIATACTGCYLSFGLLVKKPPEIRHWIEFWE